MPTTINCPSCSRTLRVPDELLGKNVKCPTCGTTFTASGDAPPPEDEEPAPAAAPRTPAAPVEDDEPEERDERRPRRRRREYLQPHRGVLILILGILGLVVFQPLGIVAWILGNTDLKEMRAGRMDPEGEGMTNAGRICGIIATVLMIFSVVLVCGCVGIGMIGALSSNH